MLFFLMKYPLYWKLIRDDKNTSTYILYLKYYIYFKILLKKNKKIPKNISELI